MVKNAQNWWAQLWIQPLHKALGAKFSRTKSSAGKTAFDLFEIEPGKIKAKCFKENEKPCYVKIETGTIPADAWRDILMDLCSQTIRQAKLRAGILPENTEALFKEKGFPLFPPDMNSLRLYCARHGESALCTHTAAAYFRFAELMDKAPFLIFELRGLSKEHLSRALQPGVEAAARKQEKQDEYVSADGKDLESGLRFFWRPAIEAGTAKKTFLEAAKGGGEGAAELPETSLKIRGASLKEWLLRVLKKAALLAKQKEDSAG